MDKIAKRIIVFSMLFSVMLAIIQYLDVQHVKKISASDLGELADDIVLSSIEYKGKCEHDTHVIFYDNSGKSQMCAEFGIGGNGMNDDFIDIRGWALVRNEDINTWNINVLLKSSNEDYFLCLSTEPQVKTELTAFFGDDQKDYDYAGFLATVRKSGLQYDKYDIYLWYQNNGYNYLVDTKEQLNVGED